MHLIHEQCNNCQWVETTQSDGHANLPGMSTPISCLPVALNSLATHRLRTWRATGSYADSTCAYGRKIAV